MDKRAGPAGEIPLEWGEISPSGMKMFPYTHSRRAGPVGGVERILIFFYAS